MAQAGNPFITAGYVSAEYFCDREAERKRLLQEVADGNNIALVSTRRMGKTGLIEHCFRNKQVGRDYYVFFVDIYASKSLRDFVFLLSKVILEELKPFGRKALELFWGSVKSLQAGITFDVTGNPSFHVQLGDIQDTAVTLDELFTYLKNADKPCIVAIDEFQQITGYPEKNIEAMLRTHIQHCPNARFIFSGSQQHMMTNMFLSGSRPFYQSVSMMHLESIPLDEYTAFAQRHFGEAGKRVTAGTVEAAYRRFNGITWYLQKVMNVLFSQTERGETCEAGMLDGALDGIVNAYQYVYSETLFRLPEKQKELLVAIAKEGKAKNVTSGSFVKKYSLSSPSSVQSALKGLLEKDFITQELGVYSVYDLFLSIWLQKNY